MKNDIIYRLTTGLHERALESGGFCHNIGMNERVDATAWAVLALDLIEGETELVKAGRNRLAAQQSSDGRIALTDETPGVYWPTPIGLLAWNHDSLFYNQRALAVDFLLCHGGITLSEQPLFMEHNTKLQGWPWVEGTYSWVEPTSMVLMALESQGEINHARYQEGICMLIDRMLPEGGWNYGNRKVFDSRLKPLPEYTGMALCALRHVDDKMQLNKSLNYLETAYHNLNTPLSLSWTIRGLSEYGLKPKNSVDRIGRCLELQSKYGPFDTSLLAQLAIALVST
ncbi:hypothetical protein [Desulfosediminicola sp.]|uniref:hypothetical protein n=1 Tax=Desulfosediminicola sp. TaxID=2886825 RepID=UPI003AF25CE1